MRMKTLKTAGILFVLFAILTGSVFAAAAQQQGPTKMSVSQTSSAAHPWQKACLAFADYVNSRSNGRYEAQVFPDASLSQRNYTIMMEQIQSGALQIGRAHV